MTRIHKRGLIPRDSGKGCMYSIQSKLRTHLGAEELQKLAQFNPHRASKYEPLYFDWTRQKYGD